MSLPLLVGIGWYTWSTYVRYERYRSFTDAEVRLDPELFQLLLHDELDRHLRRLAMDPPPSPPTIPLFELSIDPDGHRVLAEDARSKKKRRYVSALVRKDGVVYDARVRHQGRRHWHALGVQKSLKVRVDKGELIEGVRTFNLLNDVTPFGYEEELILDLAREGGLLAPEFHPVRVRIDNADLGVYRFEAQPDEGLLRRLGRMPGSLYSGSFRARCTEPRCGWGKFGAATQAEREDFREIDDLLEVIADGSHQQMARFADERIDLERFAFFDALDVVFGGDQHDFESNHKLYFDRYRGRFEPIARDFRAFTHAPFFDLAENPLRLRLKALPDYLWRRDRHVYALLTGAASIDGIESRVDAWFTKLRPELRSDPYWDAYKLLGRASKFHRFLVRPMSVGRWLTAARAELATFATRHRFLLDHLEAFELRTASHLVGDVRVVEIEVGGYDAHRVTRIGVDGNGGFDVYADTSFDGVLDAADAHVGAAERALEPSSYALLVPGVRTVEVGDEDVAGPIRTEREPRTYRYFVVSSSGPTPPVTIELASVVTGATTSRTPSEGALPNVRTSTAGSKWAFVAGESSPHPWSFEQRPRSTTVVLGPGDVVFDRDRRFERHESVRIQPGTTLQLGPKVVLGFRGRVDARGTASAPIRIVAPRGSFGGVVVRGPETGGSRFEHVEVRGGSRPEDPRHGSSSLFSIFDTSNVTLEHVLFEDNLEADDLLHATYVDGLALHEVRIVGAKEDALDLEHTDAEVRGLRILGAGDECVDLMTSKVRMTDSLLVGCQGNAISAGEETDLTVLGSVIARSKVGVLSKNSSAVRISRSLVYEAHQALRTNKKDVHYVRPSRIDARDTFLVGCETNVRRAKRTKVTADIETSFPSPSRLSALRRDVVGVSSWSAIDARLDALVGGRP